MSDRLPRIALAVFIVGLAVHNLLMAELWDVGVRGTSLDVVAAWKDVLLAAALVVALLAAGKLPSWLWADRLALLYAALVLLYWFVPSGLARGRRRNPEGPAPRCPPRPDPGRRLLPRAPARAHAGDVAAPLPRARRGCRGGHRLGARRRLPRAAAVVARLGRARVVRRAARPRLQRGTFRAARELGIEHGGRTEPDPPARSRPSSARSRPRTFS